MSQHYERIMIAVDGSYESELAFEKGVNVALRNKAELILTHVIDTRALQSIATFDTYIYEQLEEEAKGVLEGFEKIRGGGRDYGRYHTAHAAAFFCGTYAPEWGGYQESPGNAGAFGHLFHPDVPEFE